MLDKEFKSKKEAYAYAWEYNADIFPVGDDLLPERRNCFCIPGCTIRDKAIWKWNKPVLLLPDLILHPMIVIRRSFWENLPELAGVNPDVNN